MVTDNELTEAIYAKYIAPTERPAKRLVGIELEYPIVNLTDATDKEITRPVDFEVVHRLADSFVSRFGLTKQTRDDNGFIYNAEDIETGDILSFDCSYNTLELSFGVEDDLSVVRDRFDAYYSFIQEKLRQDNHMITGLGINPGYKVNIPEPVANGRYRMLYRHLQSYVDYGNVIPFHHYPNFGMFSCASQVQLDINRESLVESLNTYTRLEPVKAVLLANSAFTADENHSFLASRDYLWKYSLHGINPHNVDDYDTILHSLDEVVNYIKTMSLYCIDRDGKYINFPPMRLDEYFRADRIRGKYFDQETGQDEIIEFEPKIEDLEYLRSFKFNDLTFRGTIEFRSVCEQPVKDVMASAAYHTGLNKKIRDLTILLDNEKTVFQQGYSVGELRRMFTIGTFPGFINRERIYDVAKETLDIARAGLRERGNGEEIYLEPLYERVYNKTNPALDFLNMKNEGKSITEIVEKYAENK